MPLGFCTGVFRFNMGTLKGKYSVAVVCSNGTGNADVWNVIKHKRIPNAKVPKATSRSIVAEYDRLLESLCAYSSLKGRQEGALGWTRAPKVVFSVNLSDKFSSVGAG